MTHKHAAEHTSIGESRNLEICDCGASRYTDKQGKPTEPWHTCVLCTHEYGRSAAK